MITKKPLHKRLLQVLGLVCIVVCFGYISKILIHRPKTKVLYLPDPQSVPLGTLETLNVLDPNVLATGTVEMKKHKVVIAGIIRDNAADAPVAMRYVEHIGSAFEDYRVVLFENDSSDGTQAILRYWEASNPKVHVISKQYNNHKRANLQFLADARNHYLDKIRSDPEYKDFDILMVVDMDMKYGIDIRGVEDSFSKIASWDAVCSNGIFNQEGKMFDMFAFRENELSWKPSAEEADQYLWGKIYVPGERVYPVGSDLVPVHSCFGGLGFYKMKAIEGCKYDSGECEHVPFHDCMRVKNGGKMFMNPSQMIWYSHYE